jgi:hypothetical protein
LCSSCGSLTAEPDARAAPRSLASDSEARGEGSASPLQRGFVPVARFRNAAEAGYFADELARLGDWAVTLTLEENFDAVSGHWAHRFVLAAPETQAAAVTQALGELVEQGEPDERWADDQQPSAVNADDAGGINWVPIVLTIAAGTAVLWAAKSLHDPPKRDARLAPVGGLPLDLWDDLSARPEPWVQQSDDGSRREVVFDPHRRLALIREDHDGDGIFERVRKVRRR